MSGTFNELQPSKATVRRPPKRTPGVRGRASGPAITSNKGLHRRWPESAAQVTQGLFRRAPHRDAVQPGGQRVPDPGVSQARVQAQREQEVHAGPRRARSRSLRCTVPVCSRTSSTSWNIISQQAIRRGTFGSVRHLINAITEYIASWNDNAIPFEWVATADEIVARVAIIERDFKKLLANNLK